MMKVQNRLLVVASLFLVTPAAAQSKQCGVDSLAPWAVVSRAWSRESGATWSNDSLRRVLLELQRRDQEARRDFGARVRDSTYARQLIELDRETSEVVQGILDRFGIPTRSMVGAAGASALFLVVQHSASLQERVFVMAKAAPPGEVPPTSLAMLEDRILANSGKPQVYGTQFNMAADGLWRLAPVADATGMPARREKAGIMPLDLYVCFLEEGGLRVDRSSLPP
jgi:hypothetical protein